MPGLFLYKITVNNFYQDHKNILYGITGYIWKLKSILKSSRLIILHKAAIEKRQCLAIVF